MQEADGRMEVSWSDPSDHPSSSNFHSAGRLRFHRTDPNSESRVLSLDTEEDADVMSAAMEAGSQVFHSSLLVELQRSIDQGKAFKCHQCSQKHTLQSVTFRFRNFSVSKLFQFFDGIGIGFEKFWYRKKYRYWFRKILVSKKVSVSVLIFCKVSFSYKLALLNILVQVLSNPLRLLHTDSFP